MGFGQRGLEGVGVDPAAGVGAEAKLLAAGLDVGRGAPGAQPRLEGAAEGVEGDGERVAGGVGRGLGPEEVEGALAR